MNIVIIGAGPAGYTCAIALAQKGANATIIESKSVGGVCLNEGCIPTKSLLHQTSHSCADGASWNEMIEAKNQIVTQLSGGVDALLKMNNVALVSGEARFENDQTITVDNQSIAFDKAIIATGSSPVIPAIAQNSTHCIDSTAALSLSKLPKSICIIGGGVVGCEMATMFCNAGVKVTLIEAAPDILIGYERKHVHVLKRQMAKAGIDVHVASQVTAIRDSGFIRSVSYKENETDKSCSCEKILVAVGRKANVDKLNIEAAGIQTENNIIKVNENFQTSNPNVYAIGDCASNIKLAYWSSTQAKKLAKHLTNGDAIGMPQIIPSCVFTHPEIAKVGYTEDELAGKNIRCAEFPFSASGKAHCIGEADGYVKLIMDTDTNVILGGHIVGPLATELIGILVPIVMNRLTVDCLANSVFAHPTLSEVIGEAADILLGESINFKS
jgi:dihydrolipoamide dehydrogenase